MSEEPSDRERWDAKYASDPEWSEPREPDAFVLRALELVPGGGRAVDLAGGNGRHALELARRGFEVELWDVSPVGLELARAAAARAGLPIRTRRVDLLLERPLFSAQPFELALVSNFRDRELLAELPRLLRPGGHLVYTHYTTEWPGEKPPMAFRLAPGELAAGIRGFETLLCEESAGRAGLLARLRPGTG
jgi:tellurite methyltransferase